MFYFNLMYEDFIERIIKKKIKNMYTKQLTRHWMKTVPKVKDMIKKKSTPDLFCETVDRYSPLLGSITLEVW